MGEHMKKQIKTTIIIAILLLSVSIVIALGKPLFIAIGTTCVATFFLIREKARLPKLILMNTKSVSKIMLLMFLISITIPVLMASGTLPTLIYHVSNLMVGKNLLFSAFMISTLLSMILGSALGTLTILLPLFSSIVFQSGTPYAYLIGALISGVYIGDRCSPLSSGLHLLSQITDTDYIANMKVLLKSAVLPFALSMAYFIIVGRETVISAQMIGDNALLPLHYDLALWRLLPLLLMIALLLFRVPITRVLGIVFVLTAGISLAQGADLLPLLFDGYRASVPELSVFLRTSGFRQMINVILVIFLSGILNSLLEADHLMTYIIEPFVKRLRSGRQLIMRTGLLSIVLSMVTCSQAMTAMVTGKYMAPFFDAHKVKREYLVMATANAGLNVVALIPWNVNGIMIKQLTGVSPVNYFIHSIFVLLLTFATLFIYPSILSKTATESPTTESDAKAMKL